jgi:hypothetical protein
VRTPAAGHGTQDKCGNKNRYSLHHIGCLAAMDPADLIHDAPHMRWEVISKRISAS